MAVTCKWYGNALLKALNGEINVAGTSPDTLKVMLCTSSYTPNQDTHTYKSDVTNEVTGTGYTAGGASLTSVTNTYTAGTNTSAIDADDVTWATATITARYAVVYDSTPSTDATRPLLGYVDFGADVTATGGDFKIQWDAAGILTVTPA